MAGISCTMLSSVALPSFWSTRGDGSLVRMSKGFMGTAINIPVKDPFAVKGRRRKEAQVRAGLPIISSIPVLGPLLNTLFSPLLLFVLYSVGATRFFSGFSNTTYSDSLPTKLALTLAWPVLFITSQKYRSNFKRAVR